MSVTLRVDGQRVWVEGNTYPYKQAIKDAGAHWDPDVRGWWIGVASKEKLEAALSKSTPTVSFAKLTDGSWGVRGIGPSPTAGTTVTVTKKDGTQSSETISQVISSNADGWLASIKAKAKKDGTPAKPKAARTCGNCGGTAGTRGQYGQYTGGSCQCCRPNCNCYDCRS